MQPKKQLKVQYIGIFEEIGSFYWPKMHFLKKGQKIRALADPPLIRAMPERKVFFLLMSSLKRNKNDLLISPLSVAPSCVFCVHLVSTIVNLQLHLTVFSACESNCIWRNNYQWNLSEW